MAKLDIKYDDILKEVELKADGYRVMNVLIGVCLNVVGFYASIQLGTYVLRLLSCC